MGRGNLATVLVVVSCVVLLVFSDASRGEDGELPGKSKDLAESKAGANILPYPAGAQLVLPTVIVRFNFINIFFISPADLPIKQDKHPSYNVPAPVYNSGDSNSNRPRKTRYNGGIWVDNR